MGIDSQLLSLSEAQRKIVQARVDEFKRRWDERRLPAELRDLPPKRDPLRLPLFVALVLADLRQRWRLGQTVTVESYLEACPELGDRDTAPLALIVAEYEARKSGGAPADVGDFARRFPRQADELKKRLGALYPASERPATASNGPDSLPERFGRYRILRTLGKGSMGTVYLAEDTNLGRRVALKVPHIEANDSPELRERFFREARTAATLEHPNICPAYDSGEIDGIRYLTMKFIEGKTLTEVAQGGMPPAQAAVLVGKLALALAEAHSRQIIHRDLKPSNVLINARGEPILMDFGLARKIDQTDERLTQPGAVLGTPSYMAPEQVTGNVDAHGPLTDVYSLGAVLYYLLAGRAPFSGAITRVFYQVTHEMPRPISSLKPGVHPDLEAICLRAMAKKPQDRFASMNDLAAALWKHVRQLSGAEARPAAPVAAPAALAAAGQAARTDSQAAKPDPRCDAGGRGQQEGGAASGTPASPSRDRAAVAPAVAPVPAPAAPQKRDHEQIVAVARIDPPQRPKESAERRRPDARAAAQKRPRDWHRNVPVWVWAAAGGVVLALVVVTVWLILRNG